MEFQSFQSWYIYYFKLFDSKRICFKILEFWNSKYAEIFKKGILQRQAWAWNWGKGFWEAQKGCIAKGSTSEHWGPTFKDPWNFKALIFWTYKTFRFLKFQIFKIIEFWRFKNLSSINYFDSFHLKNTIALFLCKLKNYSILVY